MKAGMLAAAMILASGLWNFSLGAGEGAENLSVAIDPAKAGEYFDSVKSECASSGSGAEAVIRWSIAMGTEGVLSLKPSHPIFAQLRNFDNFQFEFRIASGAVDTVNFEALGHVSGARQYKIHDWNIAVLTSERGKWLSRNLDLSRPNWFPWDNPDGPDAPAFFRFRALAVAPGTVIELRAVRLAKNAIRIKPDFESPCTWPVISGAGDAGASYRITLVAQNISGKPADIEAKLISSHKLFAVSIQPLDKPAEGEKPAPADATAVTAKAKNAQALRFAVVAAISAENLKNSPELAAEPLRLSFSLAGMKNSDICWDGVLVRPLSPEIRRQVVLGTKEVEQVRQAVSAKDEAALKAIELPNKLKQADELLGKKFLRIPGGHGQVSNNWIGDWRVGDTMPEIVNTKTGEKEFDTDTARRTWKEYLGPFGGACEALGNAYLFTGDEKYAQKAIELFKLYAAQYSTLYWANPAFEPMWSQGAPLLCSSRMAASSTYGSNWYGKGFCKLLSAVSESPSWNEADRKLVYEGFVLPYALELLKFPGGISNMTDITNYDVMQLGFAFRDATLVHRALYSDPGLLNRLRDIDEDGFSSEGRPLNYHGAAMDEYLPAIASLVRSGLKVEFSQKNLLAAVKMPYLRSSLAGQVPSTGDCAGGINVGGSRHADFLADLFPEEAWLRDISTNSTMERKLALLKEGGKRDSQAYRKLFETTPRVFRQAGFAILRSGEKPEEQVMLTLDYGLNVFHAALDRNTVTLTAFGRRFSQGTGSLYNAGSNKTPNTDKRLDSFCGHGSLGQNVILADQHDQSPAVGKLLAWSGKPECQVAASEVDGIYEGVKHTRALVLANGVAIILDRIEGQAEHEYDFAYHNFGALELGEGLKHGQPAKLGETANYGNIIDPKQVELGGKPVHLLWTLPPLAAKQNAKKGEDASGSGPKLALWQLPVAGGNVYTGSTGMNNTDVRIIPDAAPSLFHRVKAKRVFYGTVLEPFKDSPRVASIKAEGEEGISVTFADKSALSFSLPKLLQDFKVEAK